MQDFNDRARPPPADHQQELLKLFNGLSSRHGPWRVFADFYQMSAISLSNAVDRAQSEPREKRYLQIVADYKPDELEKFAQGLAHLVADLEANPSDVLGRTFHDLELHNKWAGQFFTPDDVCRCWPR
jgi:type I restriction-modification system DNA methylase subunit